MGSSPIITGHGQTEFDSSGVFVPGTTAVLFFTFTDLEGKLYDPSNMSIEILDPDGTAIELPDDGEALDKVETGVYGYSWLIADDAATGKYTVNLTYTVETIDGAVVETYTQYCIISETTNQFSVVTYRQTSARAFLESLTGYPHRIPVFHEMVRFNRNRTTGELSFPRWNQSAGVIVYVNGNVRTSGYSVDYIKGRITFDNPVSEYDEVTCSYNFRWFTDSELDAFIEQGINMFNIWPPHSVYTIRDIPDRWIITAEHAAAIFLLRRWMMDIQFQEPVKIFGGFERAQQVFGNLDTLKKNYEDLLDKMLTQKKFQPYLGLTKTITVPEYTLPGGRSRWFRYLFKGA